MFVSPALRRFACSLRTKNGYATAAPAAQAKLSDASAAQELRFTFASPTKAYYTKALVKQVDVPTLSGDMGMLANHVPVIASLKPGVLQIFEESGEVKKLFISSGSMSMNPDGSLQVLAEEAVGLDEIDKDTVQRVLLEAQKGAAEGSEVDRAEAQIRQEVAEAMLRALTGGQ